jgi:anti-sigma regulatory factor (Ser/Thr protein kinase)/anti-anti-sigma regulatory factor
VSSQQDSIDVSQLDTRTVLLAVDGDIDRGRGLDVQRAVGRAVRHGCLRVIVDLSAADAAAPGVFAALLHARRRLLAMGGELVVVSERDLFGADGPLPTARDVDQALLAATPFSETRPAVVASVAPLRRAVTRWAVRNGAGERTRDSVALASSEAITNAVIHAYRDAARPGDVTVSGEMLPPERLRVAVADRGGGMQPRSDSPGLGLGLPLITQIAGSVEIKSHAEGTRIAMDFDLVSGR